MQYRDSQDEIACIQSLETCHCLYPKLDTACIHLCPKAACMYPQLCIQVNHSLCPPVSKHIQPVSNPLYTACIHLFPKTACLYPSLWTQPVSNPVSVCITCRPMVNLYLCVIELCSVNCLLNISKCSFDINITCIHYSYGLARKIV